MKHTVDLCLLRGPIPCRVLLVPLRRARLRSRSSGLRGRCRFRLNLNLLAHMELDLAGIQTATTVVHTDQGDYDHTNATTLFDDNTTSAMISVSEPEMSLLGYTRDGLNHQWTALTRTPTDYIPVDGGFANPNIGPADEDGSSEAGSGGEAGTSNATVTTP